MVMDKDDDDDDENYDDDDIRVNVKDDDDNAAHQEVHAAVRKWLAEKAGPTVAAETRWR